MENHKLNYVLHLADNGLVLGQRLGEWCGHGPVLEQDIALTNIALDVIGQARYFYQYAAELDGKGKLEDDYAYHRGEREFKNYLLLELPNGDWAQTIFRQFFYDTFCQLVYTEMLKSSDKQLAAIASKAIKEVNYHYKFSSEWVIRMGDGTEESHRRAAEALDLLWEYTGEFFQKTPYDAQMVTEKVIADVEGLKAAWTSRVKEVLEEATLSLPEKNWFQTGGKKGIHTEYLGILLTDLQYLQRTYPGLEW